MDNDKWSKIMLIIKNRSNDYLKFKPHYNYTNETIFKQKLYYQDTIQHINDNKKHYEVEKFQISSLQALLTNKKDKTKLTVGTGNPSHCNFIFVNRETISSSNVHVKIEKLHFLTMTYKKNATMLSNHLQKIIDCTKHKMIDNSNEMAQIVNDKTIELPDFTNNFSIDANIVEAYLQWPIKHNFKRLSIFVQHDQLETWELIILRKFGHFLCGWNTQSIFANDLSIDEWENSLKCDNLLPIITSTFLSREALRMLSFLGHESAAQEKIPVDFLKAACVKTKYFENFLLKHLQDNERQFWYFEIQNMVNRIKRVNYNKEMLEFLQQQDQDIDVTGDEDSKEAETTNIDWGLLAFGLCSKNIGLFECKLRSLQNKYGIMNNFDQISCDVTIEAVVSGSASERNFKQLYHMYPLFRKLIENMKNDCKHADMLRKNEFTVENLHLFENLLMNYLEFLYIIDIAPLLSCEANRAKIIPIQDWMAYLHHSEGSSPFYLTKLCKSFYLARQNKQSVCDTVLSLYNQSSSDHGPITFSIGGISNQVQVYSLDSTTSDNSTKNNTSNIKGEKSDIVSVKCDDDVIFIKQHKKTMIEHTFTTKKWVQAWDAYEFMKTIEGDMKNLKLLTMQCPKSEDINVIKPRLGYTLFPHWTDKLKEELESVLHNPYNVPTVENNSEISVAINILILAIIVVYLEWIGNQVYGLLDDMFEKDDVVGLKKWDNQKWVSKLTKQDIQSLIKNETAKNDDCFEFWIKYRDEIVEQRRLHKAPQWFDHTVAGQQELFRQRRRPKNGNTNTSINNTNNKDTNTSNNNTNIKDTNTSNNKTQNDKDNQNTNSQENNDITMKNTNHDKQSGENANLPILNEKFNQRLTQNSLSGTFVKQMTTNCATSSNPGKGPKKGKGATGSAGATSSKPGKGKKKGKGATGSPSSAGSNDKKDNDNNGNKVSTGSNNGAIPSVQNHNGNKVSTVSNNSANNKSLQIFYGDKWKSLHKGATPLRVLGYLPIKHQYKFIAKTNNPGKGIIESLTHKNGDKKYIQQEVRLSRLYSGSHLPLALCDSSKQWHIVKFRQKVQINVKLLSTDYFNQHAELKEKLTKFSNNAYNTEYGYVTKQMSTIANGICLCVDIEFMNGSGIGTQAIPVSLLQIVDYVKPKVNEMVFWTNYWNSPKVLKPNFDITNINGVGGDGTGPWIEDELLSIDIRRNLNSTETCSVQLGDYIYMFSNSYIMQKVKLKYIVDLNTLRVQTANKKIVFANVDEVLKDEHATCVIWNPQYEQYEPIYVNQLLGYDNKYYHTFDSKFDFNVSKWKVCLREIGGGDNLLWVFGENLIPVFNHNWTTSNGSFFIFATNICQNDGHYDEAGRFLNQGDALRKYLKNFDQNKNEIKSIVDDINEYGINTSGIQNHKRFNNLGFAMQESNDS